MAQSTTPARASSAPQPTAPLNPGIEFRTAQTGSGGGARSQALIVPPSDPSTFFAVVDPKAFEKGIGRGLNLNVMKHRDALVQELRKSGSPDMAQVKASLQGLVAENKARCHGKTPDGLHLYMGFGGVDPEERHEALTWARTLSTSAAALKGQLDDPECEQMLEWLGNDWRAYEDIHAQQAPDNASAKGYRKSMIQPSPTEPARRTGAGTSAMSTTTSYGSRMEHSTASASQEVWTPRHGPSLSTAASEATTTNSKVVTTHTTTNTTATTTTTGIKPHPKSPKDVRDALWRAHGAIERTREKEGLQNPDEILRRAAIRDSLFEAFDAKDDAKVASILHNMPGVRYTASYFPAPSALRSYAETVESATRYREAHGPGRIDWFNNLRTYAWRARCHAKILHQVQREPEMRKLYPLEVQEVCCALMACHEAEVKTNAKALETAIKKAMKSKRLADHLAQQPFASVTLLDQRCTLLEQHTGSKSVREFHKMVVQAHEQQKRSAPLLGKELLRREPDQAELKALLRINHAFLVTLAPTTYPMTEGRTWVQVEAIRDNVDNMLSRAKRAVSPDLDTSWEVMMLETLKHRLDKTMNSLEESDEN